MDPSLLLMSRDEYLLVSVLVGCNADVNKNVD